ncbi:shikimate kinase [Pontibacillus sp. HMF3514]|uniref:shikimate kinase n=1 Tax=Pontibacillus sp. HMF3514 TaxID=2692425 RepID=UPI0013204168|nr:shikimate kinase [Pontibacillus sp. HMF3514]QHE52943.1 AAA family ATPase [Pontibacillus sp. HMF3514]
MNNIVLIGFMGSGKSSVGKLLAEQTHRTYIDLDQKIEEDAGDSIPNIFKKEGEEGFRMRETEVLRELSSRDSTVISTGGGIVEREENLSVLKEHGPVIYLHASFEEISARLQEDESRPLWSKPEAERRSLLEKRLPVYKEWADYLVNTDQKSIDDVVAEINSLI